MAESPLASEAMHRFLLIHRHLRQYAHQMDDQGIRPKQFSVLRFLLEHGPATVGEVQEYLYNSASTTSALLSQMEEAGHVTRTRSHEDNRVVIIELTGQGQAIAEDSPMGGIPLLRRRLRGLPEDRLAQINAALADIMELIEVEDTE
jgi:DNA-binding MarR family transcriptional regulator